MTELVTRYIINVTKLIVLIFTKEEVEMSFVISRKQYLAPNEPRAQYEPLIFEEEDFEVKKIDVTFGHPLYTTVADIFYIRSDADTTRLLPIVPDGCMALVFCGNREKENIRAYICGVTDEIKKMKIEPDEYYIFIRFLPGIGHTLLDQPANRLTNKAIPLKGHLAGGDQIISILERETHLVERIRLISKVIRVNLHSESNKYLIKYCTERILQTQGNIKVEELAEESGFTARHIGKMFERCVGISPKLYSQIIRLQLSMTKILEDRNMLLVDIAIDSGFFDHAHMNRMYKKLIHCSSGEFRKNLFNRLDYSTIDDYISIS